jgi:hypothetical protein
MTVGMRIEEIISFNLMEVMQKGFTLEIVDEKHRF